MGCRFPDLVCLVSAAVFGVMGYPALAGEQSVDGRIRVATFNCSLNRSSEGRLVSDLRTGQDAQAIEVAAILRRIRPDIVLLNEFDFDSSAQAIELFRTMYLNVTSDTGDTQPPLQYDDYYAAPSNTGVPAGRDLDHDGRSDGPGDAFGFGRFPGQYGMVVLSRFPIDKPAVRSFQKFLWKDLPNAAVPVNPSDNKPWYTADEWQVLRLSSKSHWDIPIRVSGVTLHILASHPTPPAFDGPEDRNGKRNHDEIRLWAEYITAGASPSPWLRDDQGRSELLPASAYFVILGDQNADPNDGNSHQQAIQQLLTHPRINAQFVPVSDGAVAASVAQAGLNLQHIGPPGADTSDFNDQSVGNLRVDYVLPARDLRVLQGGVFWPAPGQSGDDLVDCSDHRLVWLDLQLPK